MERDQLEAIIAAILTTVVIDSAGTTAKNAINRYAQVLDELRKSGGPTGVVPPPR